MAYGEDRRLPKPDGFQLTPAEIIVGDSGTASYQNKKTVEDSVVNESDAGPPVPPRSLKVKTMDMKETPASTSLCKSMNESFEIIN